MKIRLSKLSFYMGLLSMITSFIPYFSLPFSVMGIVFGIVTIKYSDKNKSREIFLASWGIFFSVIGFFLGIFFTILFDTLSNLH